MNRLSRVFSVVALGVVSFSAVFAQAPAAASEPQPSALHLDISLLSDTSGANLDAYMHSLDASLKGHWQAPDAKQGETYIRFTILPDGRIGSVKLESSSHDVAIDRAAWNSVVGEGQFAPLPQQFHGPALELRVHFAMSAPSAV